MATSGEKLTVHMVRNTSLNQNEILFSLHANAFHFSTSKQASKQASFSISFHLVRLSPLFGLLEFEAKKKRQNERNVLMVIKSSERRVKTIKIPTILNHIRNSSTGSCSGWKGASMYEAQLSHSTKKEAPLYLPG